MAICQKISYEDYPLAPVGVFMGVVSYGRARDATPIRREMEVCAENAEGLERVLAGRSRFVANAIAHNNIIRIGEPRQATSLVDRFLAWLSSL